jgi:charged multivesicular body protein 4
LGQQVDDTELEDELAELQQQELEDKMLETGTVPVSDNIQRLPAVANGESELIPDRSMPLLTKQVVLTSY